MNADYPSVAPIVGDMVVTSRGVIGLLSHITPAGMMAVQFGQNVQPRYYRPQSIRRATLTEVQASHLNGVGCNQANH